MSVMEVTPRMPSTPLIWTLLSSKEDSLMKSMFCRVEFVLGGVFVASASHQPALVLRGERWKRYYTHDIYSISAMQQVLVGIYLML